MNKALIPTGPLSIGLYELSIKETPDRGQLKFFKRLSSIEIPEFTPAITLTLEGETAPSKFVHQADFSAEVGHFAYARNKDNKGFAPTPYNPALIATPDTKGPTTKGRGKGKK